MADEDHWFVAHDFNPCSIALDGVFGLFQTQAAEFAVALDRRDLVTRLQQFVDFVPLSARQFIGSARLITQSHFALDLIYRITGRVESTPVKRAYKSTASSLRPSASRSRTPAALPWRGLARFFLSITPPAIR